LIRNVLHKISELSRRSQFFFTGDPVLLIRSYARMEKFRRIFLLYFKCCLIK